MLTTEMVLFAPFLKASKFIPACISIYILSLTKTNQGRFYFYWASKSRAEDLAAVNHVTQAVVRVGSKIGYKSRV